MKSLDAVDPFVKLSKSCQSSLFLWCLNFWLSIAFFVKHVIRFSAQAFPCFLPPPHLPPFLLFQYGLHWRRKLQAHERIRQRRHVRAWLGRRCRRLLGDLVCQSGPFKIILGLVPPSATLPDKCEFSTSFFSSILRALKQFLIINVIYAFSLGAWTLAVLTSCRQSIAVCLPNFFISWKSYILFFYRCLLVVLRSLLVRIHLQVIIEPILILFCSASKLFSYSVKQDCNIVNHCLPVCFCGICTATCMRHNIR